MDNNQEYRVWIQTDNRKFSPTWEAVTPKLTQATAETIRKLYEIEYPDKLHAVSVSEPRSYKF